MIQNIIQNVVLSQQVIKLNNTFQFDLEKSKEDVDLKQWIAYCNFHLGDYNNAMLIYKNLSENERPKYVFINLACCYFYLGMYPEAEEVLYEYI